MNPAQDDRDAPGASVTPLTPADAGASRRGVVLQGADAHAWFTASGFTVESGQFHLATDVLSGPDFRLARIWHTGGRMTSPGRKAPLVFVQLEGTARLSIDDRSRELRPGGIAFIPAGSTLMVESDAPVARVELEMPAPALAPRTREVVERRLVLDGSGRAFPGVLIASVNAALNNALEPGDAGFSAFRLAISNLLAAVLTDAARGHDGGVTPRQRDLYESALEVIAREASDPGFSVARLAQALNVSQQYVRIVFSVHRTTARTEIRARRADLARTYLRSNSDRATFTATEAAHLSGFRDVETMRKALRATE